MNPFIIGLVIGVVAGATGMLFGLSLLSAARDNAREQPMDYFDSQRKGKGNG